MGSVRIVWCDAGAIRRLKVGGIVAGMLLLAAWWFLLRMPGRCWRGLLPPLTGDQARLRDSLRADLQVLAGDIGPRNLLQEPAKLVRSRDWIEGEFRAAGYVPTRQTYPVRDLGATADNVIAELPGTSRAREIVVVGAHYDTVATGSGCRGANDNGTGVVALLALARDLAGSHPARTVRFVAFVNEEPPFFWTNTMGSLVYARACRARHDRIVGMLCLETMGCYTDEPHSQRYPVPGLSLLYPTTGNFITFVGSGRWRSSALAAIRSFRRHAQFPSEGLLGSSAIPGIGWSDHWSFWQCGYPGVMVTDTAPFRYQAYHDHNGADTVEKVDYERLARVVDGLRGVVNDLAAGRAGL